MSTVDVLLLLKLSTCPHTVDMYRMKPRFILGLNCKGEILIVVLPPSLCKVILGLFQFNGPFLQVCTVL